MIPVDEPTNNEPTKISNSDAQFSTILKCAYTTIQETRALENFQILFPTRIQRNG